MTEAVAVSEGVTLTLLDAGRSGGPLYEITKTITESGSATDQVRFDYVSDDDTNSSLTATVQSYALTDPDAAP
ncbi:MAG: hypothetical protein WBC44_06465 [Planctomycetaceae bacterium]